MGSTFILSAAAPFPANQQAPSADYHHAVAEFVAAHPAGQAGERGLLQ